MLLTEYILQRLRIYKFNRIISKLQINVHYKVETVRKIYFSVSRFDQINNVCVSLTNNIIYLYCRLFVLSNKQQSFLILVVYSICNLIYCYKILISMTLRFQLCSL